jgi:prevent-host-death family protein
MLVPLSEAAAQLDELVDRAIAGEEVFFTENGQVVARLIPIDVEAQPYEGLDG